MDRFKAHLQNKFLAGMLAAIPVGITLFILWYVDSQIRAIFPVRYPFFGIIIALLAIYLLGLFVTSFAGQFFLRLSDRFLTRLPGVRDAYSTWKQILVTPNLDQGVFARVVLIPDETGRLRMLGFTSGRPVEGSTDTLCVFVPASPNPISGRLYFVGKGDYQFLRLGAKEAFKFIISGGNYVPPALGAALAAPSLSPPVQPQP